MMHMRIEMLEFQFLGSSQSIQLENSSTSCVQTSYESQSLEVDYYFPCLTAVKQIRDIIAANTRKQSIYFDVIDFVPIQTRKEGNGDHENLSDNEDNVVSKPFRARSGSDISDMLSSAKHRRNIRRSLQISGGKTKKEDLGPEAACLDEINIKEPISRCPSLDLEAFVAEDPLVGDVMVEDIVGELVALNMEASESENDNDNVREISVGVTCYISLTFDPTLTVTLLP